MPPALRSSSPRATTTFPEPVKPHNLRISPSMRYSSLLALTVIWACQNEPTVPVKVEALEGSAAGRPNIVVIMTDDQTVENTRVMTHTLELIGAQGVTFDNSIVTQAVCCPSRATFLTGQYPHNH